VDAWTRTVDVSADAPRDTTTQKRWYEREPIAVFVPLSVLAATVLQTIAYTGYKLFYNSLGVRPEEVGYDYASLFPAYSDPSGDHLVGRTVDTGHGKLGRRRLRRHRLRDGAVVAG
jgi:hypothetical protein